MKVIVTGGGTGGHIYPAMAIAECIIKDIPQSEVLFVGSENGLERDIVSKSTIPFAMIKAKGMPRKISRELLSSTFEASRGLVMANRILKDFEPDLVIGTGGFVCGPTMLAAKRLRIPTMIHEQNAYPGLTNKLLAPLMDCVLLNFPEARSRFKGKIRAEVTGLPVRSDMLTHTREEGCAFFGLDPKRRVLLVTGGSRGARTINRVVAMSAERILRSFDVQILFITGSSGYTDTSLLLRECGIQPFEHKDLILRDYVYDMPYALAAADLVIGRAGATFLAEIAMCGLPGILIPYPYASENHQAYNAQAMVDAGGAVTVADKSFTVPRLMEMLYPFLEDDAYRYRMAEKMKSAAKPHAMDDIMEIIKSFN